MNRLALFALTACSTDKSSGDDTGGVDAADADCNDADNAINPSAQ